MIRIIAGGKKNTGWVLAACDEYEKRLRKPFDIKWEFLEEQKLDQILAEWNFDGRDFVILTDERGQNLSSPDFARMMSDAFVHGKNIVIIIGAAFGVKPEIREKADFVWSFSKLVFPHLLMRVMVTEQIYRASDINKNGKYHHA